MIQSNLVNIKFINYTGKWPNLCSGVLTLEVNGKIYKFGYEQEYDKFWSSGGCCGFIDESYTEEFISQNEWIIDKDELPDELKNYSDEISRVFNENVEQGCCGGCL